MASSETPPRVSKQNSTGQISSRSSGLGRGQSPYFNLNSFAFPNLTNDLTADQKTVKRSSSADDSPQTAGQSPPPKPPRKKSPRPQSKLADHSSQATNGAETPPLSSSPQPSRQTDFSRLSTDDTVYLPPASKPTTSSNYDSLLPKQKADVYDHLGPNTTDLASLLPNTMSRYRSEAKQKPTTGATTELNSKKTPTECPSNSTELPVNEDLTKTSEVTKNGEIVGPTNLPWKKLPRVDIKDEPEVHAWRNLGPSVTEPSLSLTRDIEYSMEPRNFSQAFHVPKNQCSLKADTRIEEEEEEKAEAEVTEGNEEQQKPSGDEAAAESHAAMSLGGVPDMRMDLEYSMEPRMYAFRNQQTSQTLPLAESKGPKKKRKDGERKKKRKEKREVSEKKENEERLAEERGKGMEETDIKERLTEDKVKDIEKTDQDKKLPKIEEELEKDIEEHKQTAKEATERRKKKKGTKQVKEAKEDDDGSRKTKPKRKSKSESRLSKTSQDSSTAVKEQVENDKPQVEQEVPQPETQDTSAAQLVVETPVERKSEALQSKTQDSPRTNKQETVEAQVNGNDRVGLLLEVAERKQNDSANEQIEDHRQQQLVEHTPNEETNRREREKSSDTTSTPVDSSPEPQRKPSPKHDLSPSHFGTLPVGSSSPIRHRARSGSYGEADSLKSKAASMVRSRQRKTVYGLASPSSSFGSGTEDSIGWGAMSVTDYEQQLAPYVVKPGDVQPSKSKWVGFKKSLMGEKKPHSIFNPKNKEKLIKYLVNPKVNVNATNDAGQTALHSYVHADRPDKLELLVTLLSHCNCKQLDIDAPDRYGNSPLLVAVEMNDFPSVKALLSFGANINCPNTFGETPLDRVFKQLQYGDRDDLHDLFCRLHAVQGKGMPSPHSAKQEPLNESINSIVNESYEIEEAQKLGVYLEPKRLTAFVFKLEEMMKRHDLEFSVNTKLSMPVGFQDNHQTFFDPMIARQSQLLRISEWKSTLDFNLGAGSRMLVLDGGGIRGLIEIEILEKIEKLTGRRIIELFDWIVGTSTGGIIALALVYLGLTLPELRQMYFRMREEVLCGGLMSVAKKSDALEHLLKSHFGNINMKDKDFPKVMIGAVSTKQNPPLLHFFNNCFNDEFSGHLVWKVARYTTAGPGYFTECDRYMDGGVMANNPSLAAWTDINRICAATSTPPPRITMVVSLGTGVYPPEQMGSTDILGKGRLLDLRGTFRRVHRFIKMLATALSESETVASAFRATCDASGIKFFRFSPILTSIIGPDETDPLVVVDMIMLVKEYLSIQSTQQNLDEMVKLFRHISDISRGLNLEK